MTTSFTKIAASMLMAVAMMFTGQAALADGHVHEVKMYNKDPDNPKARNVFIPALVKIQPGDTVKFISADKGHNSESIKGMLPEGAETWKSKVGKDFEITFSEPGVYGYKCTPHYALGMVGLVVVEGDGWDANLAAAQEVKQRGKSRQAFEALWEELAAADAEAATN